MVAILELARISKITIPKNQEDEAWNGYSLNALVDGLNPLFTSLYNEFINPPPEEFSKYKITKTRRLQIPKEAGEYFDWAIEDWGKISGRNDKQVQGFKLTQNTTTVLDMEQEALVLQSRGLAIGFVSLITKDNVHGFIRYGAIYIPDITDATLEHGVASSEMRAAILLNAAQTAMKDHPNPPTYPGAFPHFRYLPTNKK